jgi:hypothetical protein
MSTTKFPNTTYGRARAYCEVAFLLREATALGLHVGTDGTEVVMLAPVRVPYETQKWFATKLDEFRAEVIAFIQRENAGGRS